MSRPPYRILHVIPSIGSVYGGPSVMVRLLARIVSEVGLEVHIATTDDNGAGRLDVPYATPVKEDGVTFWYFKRQTRFYKFSWPLTRWLQHHVHTYDTVHIHALFSYAALPAAYWAHKRGVPYIVRPLGTLNQWGMVQRRPWLKKWSLRAIEGPILEHAAAVHYTSVQEQIEAEAWGIRPPAVIIPNAVDDTVLNDQEASETFRMQFPACRDRLCLLFLSRLDPKKGLDLLLPAFAGFLKQYPAAVLILAGSGEETYVESLKQQADLLGISPHLIWTGFLEGINKTAALAVADLFVLPSYSENFGVAVVEAMACGLPVVISDQTAVHREVSQFEAGLVVPCAVAPITAALCRLADYPMLRAKMGDNGSTLVQTHFSVPAVRDQLLKMYKSVIERASD